jgi:cytochrome oxidase Cu insertion factor (SCO1/SenC/PrrC family)
VETEPTAADPGAPIDRAAALAAGAPRVPRRVVVLAVIVAAVLAIGGVALEDAMSAAGLNPKPAPTPKVEIATSLQAFMALSKLNPAPAPAFRLVDQAGRRVSLASFKGSVVVLSFFNASCSDICPVLTKEMATAEADLGASARHVVFLTVDTDPFLTGVSATTPAVTQAHLGDSWYMLGGPFNDLDAVWAAYGITINASATTGLVAHNNAIYFIDGQGDWRFKAAPYADENSSGGFSLSAASLKQWGTGIADYARKLLATAG